MNKVLLSGILTRDPENNNGAVRFSVACNRTFKSKDGKYDADFPNCIAFGKTGEFVEKFFKKGSVIEVVGRVNTGSYTNKEGKKVYTTDIAVEAVEFGKGKKSESNSESSAQNTTSNADGFMNIPDGIDEELPFN